MYKLSDDYERMFRNAVLTLTKYIDDNNIQSLVLGVSGGVDSALVAALAYNASGLSENTVPVIGRSITIESNTPEERERAEAVGLAYCDDFKELDLTLLYNSNLLDLDLGGYEEKSISGKIANGNIKARIRMIQLYHLAGINKGMVLSTDNYTELLLGFWTLHGDVGDYGMVQNLWKTEIYGLTEHLADKYYRMGMKDKANALDLCIQAVPTDGLGITDSDLDQLGASSYTEVDRILIGYLNGLDCNPHPVIDRYNATHFKRENPYNIPREELL